MPKDKSSVITFGQVKIKLDGDTLTLKPTLSALLAIEDDFGGLASAVQSLGAINIRAVACVIAAGAGVDISREEDATKMQKSIFNYGIADAAAIAVEFTTSLLNPTGAEKTKPGK